MVNSSKECKDATWHCLHALLMTPLLLEWTIDWSLKAIIKPPLSFKVEHRTLPQNFVFTQLTGRHIEDNGDIYGFMMLACETDSPQFLYLWNRFNDKCLAMFLGRWTLKEITCTGSSTPLLGELSADNLLVPACNPWKYFKHGPLRRVHGWNIDLLLENTVYISVFLIRECSELLSKANLQYWFRYWI